VSTLTKEVDAEDDELLLPDSPDPLVAARARRLLALQAAEGLWKDRTDIPKDGVEAQEQLRVEWHWSCLTPISSLIC
jgi:hypothetical protein